MELIQEFKLGVIPQDDSVGPVLLQSDQNTFLVFSAQKETEFENNGESSCQRKLGTATVKFNNCLATKFGHPNDEAALGMPKYSQLEYDVCEVKNSDWIKEHEEINNFSFPGTSYSEFRHFVFFFHDSTFESISKDVRLDFSDKPIKATVALLSEKILEEGADKLTT